MRIGYERVCYRSSCFTALLAARTKFCNCSWAKTIECHTMHSCSPSRTVTNATFVAGFDRGAMYLRDEVNLPNIPVGHLERQYPTPRSASIQVNRYADTCAATHLPTACSASWKQSSIPKLARKEGLEPPLPLRNGCSWVSPETRAKSM